MDFHKICRICLKGDLLVSIFSPTFLLRPVEVMEKLNICEIEENLPKFLCQSCLYRLLDAYNLQQLAAASKSQLLALGNELNSLNNHTILPMDDFRGVTSKKASNLQTNFCDFFQVRECTTGMDRPEEILNDVEIDVSSLTRSEGTLSEVFVDTQINCHYDSNTSNYANNLVDDNATVFENVLQPPSNVEAKNGNITSDRKKKSWETSKTCLDCGKKFSTAGYLKIHQRTHSGEKPFECKYCQRRFVHRSNLLLHHRVHIGERRFQCDICANFFTTSSNLKAHIMTHSELPTFKCDQCHLAFKSERSLKRHAIIHEFKKEICCNICRKSFSKLTYLQNHIQTVHRNVRKHKCKDCGKSFASLSNLKCHSRIHSGEKPYECRFCTWKFNQLSALERHMKKKHRNSNQQQQSAVNLTFQGPICTAEMSNIASAPKETLEHPQSLFNAGVTLENFSYNKVELLAYPTPNP